MKLVVGFDVSMSVVAACARAYDGKRIHGPIWKDIRFTDESYFTRLKVASGANILVDLMIEELGFERKLENIIVGIEEPWPLGLIKTANSASIKQQGQMQASALTSLVRNFDNVVEVNVSFWRKHVANDLGIKMNRDFTKFHVKEWAHKKFPEMPEYADIISNHKFGKIEKPITSIAKPIQPNDLYDATAIMDYLWKTLT